jgi:hypothetical protein
MTEIFIEAFEVIAVVGFLSVAFTLTSSAVLISYAIRIVAPFVDAFL